MTTLDKDPIFALNILQLPQTTQSDRKVLEQFYKWDSKRRKGEINEVFPQIKTLAKGANVSTRTVNRALKKFDGNLLKRISGKKERKNNRYIIFESLFQIMSYLSPRGLICNWNRNKKWIEEEIVTYEDFTYKKSGLSTIKCRMQKSTKCRTIKTLNSSSIRQPKIRTQERAQSCEQSKKKDGLKFGKGYMFLKEVGATEKEARKVSGWFGDDAWFESRNDFWWFNKIEPIRNPIAFMISRAKEHTKRKLRF